MTQWLCGLSAFGLLGLNAYVSPVWWHHGWPMAVLGTGVFCLSLGVIFVLADRATGDRWLWED